MTSPGPDRQVRQVERTEPGNPTRHRQGSVIRIAHLYGHMRAARLALCLRDYVWAHPICAEVTHLSACVSARTYVHMNVKVQDCCRCRCSARTETSERDAQVAVLLLWQHALGNRARARATNTCKLYCLCERRRPTTSHVIETPHLCSGAHVK